MTSNMPTLKVPRAAWAAFAWLILGLTACETPAPSANAVPPGTAAAASASGPVNAVRFTPERATLVRTTVTAKGWVYVGGGLLNAGTPPNVTPTETLNFIQPGSMARQGNVVRVPVLVSHAAPIGPLTSRVSMMQVDCTARTLQPLWQEGFGDALATQRVGQSAVPGQIVGFAPRTIYETIHTNVCTGRFATTGTTGAAFATAGAAPFAPTRRAVSGSGFVLAPRAVMTNAHVVAQCSAVEVTLAGQRHTAAVRKRDAATDLALLDVPSLPSVATPSLRRSAVVGEPVMAAGYPLGGLVGSELVVTDGIVNALVGAGNNASNLQMSTPVQSGNSGGPLLDRGGNVVGVVTSKLNALLLALITGDMVQNVNFAIKPELVSLFLQSENLGLRYAEAPGTLDTQTLAATARAFTLKVDCKP
jgi:S1-C subfamily serine protease